MEGKFAITYLKGMVTECQYPIKVRNGFIVNAVLNYEYTAKDGTQKSQHWQVTFFEKSFEAASMIAPKYRNKRLLVSCHVNGWKRELEDGTRDYCNNLNVKEVKEVQDV